MAVKNLPFYHRILFKLLVPVMIVGILCSTLLVAYMSSPLKKFLIQQFDANLRLASVMGLRVCEESLGYLLDLRLEKNDEMNQVMQNEAIEKIKGISREFPHIHIMIIQSAQIIKDSSLDEVTVLWDGPLLGNKNDKMLGFKMADRTVRSHVQFFPFWDWHIISFVFEDDYKSPIRMAYKITYLSAIIVFLAIVGVLLLVFHLFIRKPLNKLILSTDGVAEGNLKKIETISKHEFGRLMESFNEMVDSLENEKSEVRSLIAQLKESEGLFRSQFEFGNIGIAITKPDETWVRANERLCHMTGYTEQELHRKTWEGLFDAKDLKTETLDFDRMLAGEIDNYEIDMQMIHKSGKLIYTHVNVSCFRNKDHSVRFIITSILDFTKRRLAEEQIRNLRNYLSNIIDSMPSVLIGVDKEGKVTQWNSKTQHVTGVSPDKALDQPLELVFPSLSTEIERLKKAIRMKQVCSNLRQARKGKEHTLFEDITIYPLVTNGVEGAVIRVDDVTDQVRLQEMMVQSEKMLSVGGLAAGMAHEINNPLAGMMQTANVMKSRLQDLEMPANLNAAEEIGVNMEGIKAFMKKRGISRMIDTINESGKRVAEIVDNMLSFARKSDSIFSSYQPDQLMDQILEIAATDYDLKKQYDFKKIKIVKEYQKNLPMIPCEMAKIQQVLLNILRNGAQAMQSESADKSIEPCFILRLLVEKETNMLKIEIEDNGPGMDEKTQSRIFEPFFTTKPAGIGTGLGLSVSYFIITENHGGTMDVESIPEKGSTLIIRLPLEDNGVKNES